MLGTQLRDFNTGIRKVDEFLLNPFHFVAKNKGEFLITVPFKMVQGDASRYLLYGNDPVTVVF